MPTIHPTSIVEREDLLADDVTVGPWCLIRGDVTIGAGTVVMERVTLQGPMTIGQHNTIYANCTLGLPPQDYKYDPSVPGAGVVIGDHNILREGFTIHRATGPVPTTMGHHNMFMVNTHIAHDVILGNRCIFANGSAVGGHAVVEDQVIMSGYVAVHQFCRIGRLSLISGNQSAMEDLPPFCMIFLLRSVSDLNLIGLRRAGYRASIVKLKAAFKIYYRDQHTRPVALKMIDETYGDDPLCKEFADFIRKPSKRGIAKYLSGRLRTRHHDLVEEDLKNLSSTPSDD